MNPKISIVLPVRDGSRTLYRAFTSIQRQSFEDWELVVVDDGSQDETPAILASLQKREKRVKVVRQEGKGIVGAIEKGVAEARSPWIARLDADDEMHPERLQLQWDFIKTRPETDLLGSRVAFVGNRDEAAGYARYVDWTNEILTHEAIGLTRFVESPLVHPSLLYRKELHKVHGGFREGDFPEDYECWLRWFEAGVRFAKLDNYLTHWHDSPNRLSRVDRRYRSESFYRIKSFYLAQHLEAKGFLGNGLYIWGAGRTTRKRAQFLSEQGLAIDAYIDIDPHKIGQNISGIPVWSPEDIIGKSGFVVAMVGSWGAREKIRRWLKESGRKEGEHFLLAA